MENNNPTPTTDIATSQESECKSPTAPQPTPADSSTDIVVDDNIESTQLTNQPDNSITKVESPNQDAESLTQNPHIDIAADCQEITSSIDSAEPPACLAEQQSETEKTLNLPIEQHVASETQSSSSSDSVANASIEVLLDVSITDRLACLDIGTAENQSDGETDNHDASSSLSAEKPAEPSPEKNQTLNKAEKTAELSRSILAGEISDTSERSIELEDEASDYVDDRVNSGEVSDEEMFIEEPEEEDVEEEEEFHEVDEEKHKTSQESVGGDRSNSSVSLKAKSTPAIDAEVSEPKIASCSNEGESSPSTLLPPLAPVPDSSHPKTDLSEDHKGNGVAEIRAHATKSADWADIMLSDSQTGEGESEEKDQSQSKLEDGSDKDDVKDVEKVLDLDEDVKNPQYIPKKGVFYEHDDRSHDAKDRKQPLSTSAKKDEETTEVKESSSNSKKPSQEKPNEKQRGGRRQRSETDRWNHDLFRDEKQKPKSKSELINAYGYDIRHERTPRNPADRGQQRGGINNGSNANNSDRQQNGPDTQRSRTNRDNRVPRQSQPSNRSGDRRPNRRQDSRGNRGETSGTPLKREAYSSRPNKSDAKDIKPQHDQLDGVKQSFQSTQIQSSTLSSTRRENLDGSREKNARNENRGRRQNSSDRPSSNSTDDKLPPITTVMPPITTWSNKIEDMVKEEANRKESPPRFNQPQGQNLGNNAQKSRPNDQWAQNQPNKNMYHDRPVRNIEDNRHPQSYNARRYQDRDEGPHKSNQFINRNQYNNDRSNQHHSEWRRNNQYNSYAKPTEYEPIKTQTFENSRLQQINMNNRSNFRDAREIINERRMQNQPNFQPKIQPSSSGVDQQMLQQRQLQHQQHQQIVQQQRQQLMQHHHLMQHQAHQHLRQQQQQQQSPTATQQQISQNQTQQQPPMGSAQPPQQIQNQQLQNQSQRQQQHQQPNVQPHPTQPRQNMVMNNPVEASQDSGRLTTSHSNSSDLINSRPIIKTDAYTGANVAPNSQQQQPQQMQHHSQNHRSSGGPLTQQGPNSASSHLVPSHMSAGSTHAQYYASPSNPRESATAAAALASAYIGYMPGGHSVMDATRYHMTSQQLSDHGYMTSPGQSNDVAAASVLHQQGMYADATSAGGTVASSAYLAQAGSTLSPSANIPVTGAGPPPLAPVSYLQHSQYAPPPYSNPYSQPQHNQAPPQSSHAYPYWTYI